jgi:aspartate kinase
MVNVIVKKFGGTSVGTAAAIMKATEKFHGTDGSVVAVLSACAGVTDILYSITSILQKSEISYNSGNRKNAVLLATQSLEKLNDLLYLHENIIKELGLNIEDLKADLENIYLKIKLKIIGAILLKELTESNSESIQSMGEYFSTLIFHSFYRKKYNQNSILIDTAEYLYIDPRSKEAVLTESKHDKLKALLSSGKSIIMQGFIVRKPNGLTGNFGRGGSDYSAALIGKLLKADRVDIYTDVDGIYSADPRKVKNAKKLDSIEAETMSIMARFGAKVMHPDSLIPALDVNLPIYIKNTFSDNEGTLVRKSISQKNDRSQTPTVTYSDNITYICIDLTAISKSQIKLLESEIANTDIDILISSKSITDWQIYVPDKHKAAIVEVIREFTAPKQFEAVNSPLVLLTSMGKGKTLTESITIGYDGDNSGFNILDSILIEKSIYIGRGNYVVEFNNRLENENISDIHDAAMQHFLKNRGK